MKSGARAIVVLACAALPCWLAAAAVAADDPEEPRGAGEQKDAVATASAAEVDAFLSTYYPAPVEGPELRLPVTPRRLYVDASYARTDDLSSLPYITGKARNLRLAVGGSLRWGRLAFTGELPLLQLTTVDVASVMNQPAQFGDGHQSSASLGDLRVGVDWTDHLTDAIVAGFGLRARLPTHTTGFTFHLDATETANYRLPYYFHVEPTAIFGAAAGPFAFVVNQGAVVLLGPDGDFEGYHIHVPTVVFWDAAYAVSWAPVAALGASLQLSTDIQLNHVGGLDFTSFNDMRSAWLGPALQWHVAGCRVDAIARFGMTKGTNLFGILELAGTTSYTLRVTRPF